jgi:hypothetical protein
LEDQELLSKKDLLALTGISYGQLYRWKRQNLIPESWFIKQSSFTGQETFFPKEKVLKRVDAILKLKDQYSLEKLAEVFTPELTNKAFQVSSIQQVEELDPKILNLFIKLWSKENFTFRELLFVYALSEISRSLNLGESWLVTSVTTVKCWLSQVNSSDYRLLVCQTKQQQYCILLPEDSTFYLDSNSEILANLKLNELANDLRSKLTGLEVLE